MPKIDVDAAPTGHGTGYPGEFAGPCKPRRRWRLGDAVGLDQFGVNLLRLPAGAWSSQRHWHEGEDEFVWVVSGEVVLVEDDGETVLRAGDCAGWKAGVPNGHKIENRSDAEAVLLEGRLIKEYRPKYNISFRDDKNFLQIKVNLDDPFPKFSLVRLKKNDGARYYGPYAHSGALRATLEILKRKYGLRSCRPRVP